MDKLILSRPNFHMRTISRARNIPGFLLNKNQPQDCVQGYARCGLRTISTTAIKNSRPYQQRVCPHRDSATSKREIKAFRSLLRRSFNNEKQSLRQLHTGTRLCSSSSESNENESKHEKRNSEENKDSGDEWDPKMGIYFILGIGVLKILAELALAYKLDTVTVSWQDFVYDMLLRGKVKEVVVVSSDRGHRKKYADKVLITFHQGADVQVDGKHPKWWQEVVMFFPQTGAFDRKLEELENELGIPEYERLKVHHIENHVSPIGAASMVFDAAFFVGSVLLLRKFLGNMGSVGSQMGNIVKTIKPMKIDAKKGTSFKDVAGLKEAKTEILEYVDYLKAPQRFKDLGATTPRGALLLGPPGCGKTLLAKALAAESDVPFFNMAGSEFVEMIGGVGAQRVRQLFKEARSKTPCIIYIDEIDAIGRKRGGNSMSDEEEQTLNQLLVEMDGMGTVEGVVIIAATNRADLLDKALLRPGRFDRQITIDPPTYLERVELFDLYLAKIKLNEPVTNLSGRFAQMTPGMTGADIKNVCNEAAINAARRKAKFVTDRDLELAVERVVAGVEKKTNTLSPGEKKIVAYHESGHALVGWLLEHTDALLKVTIVPRTSAVLGFAQYKPSDQKLYSKQELFERMCMALGGRASEAMIFNSVTSGAQNDLQQVTKMAYDQIKCYGMSDALGHVSFGPHTEEQEPGVKPYSKSLAALIDQEARTLVAQAYKHTETVLAENRDKLQMLAKALLETETLSYSDVENLIGPPPFGAKKTMDIYPHFEGHIPDNGNGAPKEGNSAKNSESAAKNSESGGNDVK